MTETATSAADREGIGGGGPPGRSTVASDGPDAGAAVGKAVGWTRGATNCGNVAGGGKGAGGGSGGGGCTAMEGLARIGAPGMGGPEPTAGQTGDGTVTGAGPCLIGGAGDAAPTVPADIPAAGDREL